MLSGFIVSVCKWCRCSRSRSCPGLRGVSARWCASLSQAPYRSLPHKCESSFTLLLLLSPKSLVTFRGPHYRALRPDHIQSDGYSVFKVHCEMARFTDPMGPAKKSSHYVWTKGRQKRSSFEKFLLFFRPSVPQAGRIQRGPSLVKPLERPFMGVLGKIFFCVNPALHCPLWLQSYIHLRVKNMPWDGTLRNRKVRFHAGLRDRRFSVFRAESGGKC